MTPIRFVTLATLLTGVAAAAAAADTEAPTPVKLSGNGKKVSQQVELGAGVYVFRMHHTGQRNFIVRPLSTDGQKYAPLVNGIGKFDGSSIFVVDDSRTYLFNVIADGKWEISIEHPKPASEKDKNVVKGRGQQVTNALTLGAGLYVFEMRHNGKRNFIVRPFTLGGDQLQPLANEIGRFEGSSAESIPAGQYVFDVNADGDWEIAIKKQ